ncbi:MAG: NAD(P)H-dependent glycerol-3-phosphate dehydrogenase [Patescibacteria group bacterium]
MKVVINGKGAFGTALHYIIKQNMPDVSFAEKGKAIELADVVVLAVPTQSLRSVLELNKELLQTVPMINTAKGIEQNTHMLPYQIAVDVLGKDISYYSLMGPSFAGEMMQDMPTLVNIGYNTGKETASIQELFLTDTFRLRIIPDVRAIELAGALKNIYAILCGISEGLGFGMNTKVKLILLAYQEILAICRTLVYPMTDASMPGILGDLILSCTSSESRNYRFGKELVTHTIADALTRVHTTVEGYITIASLSYLQEKTGSSMSVAMLVHRIIKEDAPKNIPQLFGDFVRSV